MKKIVKGGKIWSYVGMELSPCNAISNKILIKSNGSWKMCTTDLFDVFIIES